MAWEWSHSGEACINVYNNIHRLDRETIITCLAEFREKELCDADDDRDQYGEDYDRYVKETTEGPLDLDTLADVLHEKAEELATCNNGGFDAWICPEGCHTVSFDDEEALEEHLNDPKIKALREHLEITEEQIRYQRVSIEVEDEDECSYEVKRFDVSMGRKVGTYRVLTEEEADEAFDEEYEEWFEEVCYMARKSWMLDPETSMFHCFDKEEHKGMIKEKKGRGFLLDTDKDREEIKQGEFFIYCTHYCE